MASSTTRRARWPRWPWWARWRRGRDERPDLADFGTAFALDLSLAAQRQGRAEGPDASAPAAARDGPAPLL